jgi:hypothetical protein
VLSESFSILRDYSINLYGPNFYVHKVLLYSARYINSSALSGHVCVLQWLNVSTRFIYIHEIKIYEQCGGVWLEAARSEVGGGVPPLASLISY